MGFGYIDIVHKLDKTQRFEPKTARWEARTLPLCLAFHPSTDFARMGHYLGTLETDKTGSNLAIAKWPRNLFSFCNSVRKDKYGVLDPAKPLEYFDLRLALQLFNQQGGIKRIHAPEL